MPIYPLFYLIEGRGTISQLRMCRESKSRGPNLTLSLPLEKGATFTISIAIVPHCYIALYSWITIYMLYLDTHTYIYRTSITALVIANSRSVVQMPWL